MANSKTSKQVGYDNASFLERTFKLKEHGTDSKTEILAGLTTFMTMAYIIVVNPGMLAETGAVSFEAALIATVISAAFATLLMAAFANYPFALAPGMGLNAYFVYTVILGMGYTYSQALTAVLISGVIFVLLTLSGLRQAIVRAIPANLKSGIGAGIGLFIAFLGLKNAGIMVSDPATFLGLGDVTSAPVLLAVLGLIITAVLMYKNVKGSILIGMAVTTVLAWITKVAPAPQGFFALPQFGTWAKEAFFKLDGFSTLSFIGLIEVVFAFFFVDMFDTIGTLVGVAKRSNMLDKDGSLPKIDKAMMADAVGTCFGALSGTPTVTTYVESASGVAAGGRTGLTALTVAICFLVFGLFFAPVVSAVPGFATAPALIIVGVLMMQSIKDVNWDDFSEALPTFAAISIMPFTFSISNGIAFSFILYSVIKLLSGKGKEVHWLLYVLSLAFVLKFVFL
ncbi:MAG: NCS2 family permease [Firmicutes bacterium]|nr:NCS2 family permease [Bacillota bacterium]MDD4263978.1 NCS2 family permease [Bacillota bacterium]MDD4693188.1 NCS2 family permease [Bacillota bacterium]